jgi:hypothetical protein
VFAAHEVLFQMAKAIGKNFGLVVADEGFWQDGITGTRLATDRLDHELEAFPVRDCFGNRLDPEAIHLRDLIGRLQGALAQMPDGYLRRAPLIEAGFLPATKYEDGSCSVARKMEWKRKVGSGMGPGASDEDWKEVVKQYGFVGQLPARAAMWRGLEDLIAGSNDATGRLILETSTTETGTVRWLRVQGHKDVFEPARRPAADPRRRHPAVRSRAQLPTKPQTRLRSRCRGPAHAGHPGDRDAGRQGGAGAQAAGRAEG